MHECSCNTLQCTLCTTGCLAIQRRESSRLFPTPADSCQQCRCRDNGERHGTPIGWIFGRKNECENTSLHARIDTGQSLTVLCRNVPYFSVYGARPAQLTFRLQSNDTVQEMRHALLSAQVDTVDADRTGSDTPQHRLATIVDQHKESYPIRAVQLSRRRRSLRGLLWSRARALSPDKRVW